MRAIDLFAGWGGYTTGAVAAGIEVVWAANHWPLAVEVHASNHPGTKHVCQDLRQANWFELPEYDLMLAAPACQGHSTASQPKRRQYHDTMRATAWAIVDCAEVTRPKTILVENVPAFTRWKLYHLWRAALVALGYHVEELHLIASRFGVPQRRKRLFVVASRKSLPNLRRAMRGHDVEPAFASCIDWSAPGWRPVRSTTATARARIAKGRKRCGSTFLTQHVSNHPGVPLDEPIRTITTKDQWALVRGDEHRPLTMRELARGMGFPAHYTWPDGLARTEVHRGLGNAVCPPVGRELILAATA